MSANGVGNADGGDPEVESRLRENAVTMNKMSDLRAQMEKLNVARRQKKSKAARRGAGGAGSGRGGGGIGKGSARGGGRR